MSHVEFDGEELLALARLDLEKGAVDQGLSKLKRAVQQPEFPLEVRLELARIYAQLGLRAKARPHYQAYLEARPNDLHVQFQLGMLSFEDGQPDTALGIWERVLQASANHPPALFYSALIAAQRGQYGEARRMLRSAMDVIPAENLYFQRSRDLLVSLDNSERGAKTEPLAANASDAYSTQH